MGLTMKYNAQQLEYLLNQVGERAVKGMSERMRKCAIRVRDLARDYAPIKTGLLEQSIDYKVIRDGRRNAYVVFIDLDASRFSGEGVLGDYAWVMHQQLHPYGRQIGEKRYDLGRLSALKAGGGKRVGGRFLSRAIKDGTKELFTELVNEVRKVTGASSVGVGRYPTKTSGEVDE